MSKLLDLISVNKTFKDKEIENEVIKDLSFSLEEDQIISLIGPSGCGKSTILNMISRLETPTSGTINVYGKISYMFQRDSLFEWRTVIGNTFLPLEIENKRDNENIEYVKSLLKKYSLSEYERYFPSQLSGGMRQRVALIRTLANKPDILLLDEPFSSLDYQTKLLVIDDVYKIIRDEKKSAIIVTHDISEAISLSDYIVVLSNKPCTIKEIIKVDVKNEEYNTPLKARKNPAFSTYFTRIYGDITDEKNE